MPLKVAPNWAWRKEVMLIFLGLEFEWLGLRLLVGMGLEGKCEPTHHIMPVSLEGETGKGEE